MSKEEALELLERLKLLENTKELKNNGTVSKFFIVPTDLIKSDHKNLNPLDLWECNFDFQKELKSDIDYGIIMLKRKGWTFGRSDDLECFKNLLNQD